jgi:hypothetical protein
MSKTGRQHLYIYIIPDCMIRCNLAYRIYFPLIINPFTNQNHPL